MKPGAGKRKGSKFEREVGKLLSLWVTRNKDKSQFIRSVLSGGWKGRSAPGAAWRQVGDLAANGQEAERFLRRWAVECKHRRDISLWQWWTGGDLPNWWAKLQTEAKHVGVIPMLIVRSNRMPIMVITRAAAVLVEGRAIRPAEVMVGQWIGLAIFPFTALLECDPEPFLADMRT